MRMAIPGWSRSWPPLNVAHAVVFDSVIPVDAQKNSRSFPPDVDGAVTVTVPLEYE
jgi:hypothetical protein